MSKLLSPDETATLLGVSVGTLGVWRCTRRYPLPYVRVGRKIMYRPEDVAEFISARVVQHQQTPAA